MSLRLYLLSSAVPVPHTHTQRRGRGRKGEREGRRILRARKGQEENQP